MVYRDVTPSTRRAHEAAEHARAHGKLEPFHASLLRRYWAFGQDLYAIDILRAAAAEVRLDPEALAADLATAAHRPTVERELREAHELGVDAVPTFVFDERLMVEGAQELPVFRMAMERLGVAPKVSSP